MPKAKVVSRKFKEPVVRTYPTLDRVGLVLGQEVRFHKNPHESYDYGTVMGESKDGSVMIFTHMTRSIMPEFIEVKEIGPRGGVNWKGLI